MDVCAGASIVCSLGSQIVSPGNPLLDPIAQGMMSGFDSFLKDFMTSWLGAGLLVNLDGVSVDWFRSSINLVTVFLSTIGLMVAGIRTMYLMKGEPFRQGLEGFLRVVIVGAIATVIVPVLLSLGDLFSQWILDSAGFGVDQYGLQTGLLLTNPGLAIVAGLFGLLAVGLQWGIMLIRSSLLPFLVAFWPTAEAVNLAYGKPGLSKLASWIISFIAYKPVAACIYAFAWKMKSGGDGIGGVINGIILIILAVMMLPGIMKILTPQASMGGASGGAAALQAVTVAAGAAIALGAAGATGGASAAAGGGAGTAATTPSVATGAPSVGGGTGTTGAPPAPGAPSSTGAGTAPGNSGTGTSGTSGDATQTGADASGGAPAAGGSAEAAGGSDSGSGSGSSGGWEAAKGAMDAAGGSGSQGESEGVIGG